MRHKVFVGKAMTGKTYTMQAMAQELGPEKCWAVTNLLPWPKPIETMTVEDAFLCVPYDDSEITYFIDNVDFEAREPYFTQLIDAIYSNENVHLIAAGQNERLIRKVLGPLLEECEFVFKTRDWDR